MRGIYVKNKTKYTSIPMAESIHEQVSRDYTMNQSLGFIMDFRHVVEEDIDEEHWAPYNTIFADGIVKLNDNPLNECLAGVYYIFNYLDTKLEDKIAMPKDVAFLIAHTYNKLLNYYKDVYKEEYKSFYLNVDDWNVVGYLESIK